MHPLVMNLDITSLKPIKQKSKSSREKSSASSREKSSASAQEPDRLKKFYKDLSKEPDDKKRLIHQE